MIVSERCGFVFVHIPKCAGTSIRDRFLGFHDGDPRLVTKVAIHPDHGEVDFKHLPLALLAKLVPEAFDSLRRHESFAILRDPQQRFQSAMSQRAKMYLGREIAQMEAGEIAAEIDRVIAHLSEVPLVTSPEYIHFSRQSDYVFLGGERLVDHLYPVERLDRLAADLSRLTGMALPITHANRTTVFRHPQLRRAARLARDLSRRILPGELDRRLRESGRRVLMKPAGPALLPPFRTARVRDFVRAHYASDFDLHEAALAATSISAA